MLSVSLAREFSHNSVPASLNGLEGMTGELGRALSKL